MTLLGGPRQGVVEPQHCMRNVVVVIVDYFGVDARDLDDLVHDRLHQPRVPPVFLILIFVDERFDRCQDSCDRFLGDFLRPGDGGVRALFNLAYSIHSSLPSSSPVACGPRMPLPPENETKSEPASTNLVKFPRGGRRTRRRTSMANRSDARSRRGVSIGRRCRRCMEIRDE